MIDPGIKKLVLSVVLSVFALLGNVGKADVIWTAYNDCIREGAGDSTAENATDWTIYSGRTNHATGKLKDFATGSEVEMPTVTFTMNLTSPVQTHIDYGDNFAPGTPAHDVFDGKIDFGGTIIQHSSLIGWWVEIRFTGLDPARKYTFVASAVRIEPSDLDRRSLITIRDADAYTNNSGYHSVGDAAWAGTDTTKFLAVGNATQGIVVQWDDIEPGPDGDFTIRAEADGSAGSHGRRGYALHGFMLQQIGIAGNRQPVVGAGVNQETTLPDNRVDLDGTVADDGKGEPNGFLEIEWSKVSGPGDVTFEPNSFEQKPTAILEPLKDGTYVLRLSATDGEFSVSDDVMITVRESICPTGDLSGNCIVNAEDLGVLADQWLVLPSGPADLDGDNEVRMEDFAYLAMSWGENRQRGSVQVTIEPSEVIPVARWRVDEDEGDWQLSGYTQGDLTVGSHTVHFSIIAGWDTPANRPIQVNYADTSSTSGTYVQQKGWLNVIITPQEAIDAGAKWRVEGGEWRDSGEPLGDLAVRLHTVEFMPISDWIKPANQTIQVNKNKTSLTGGTYKPLPDAPIVINEFMAVNSYVPSISSQDIYTQVYVGDTHPDWIELHSLDPENTIDLEGWYLTNDEDDLTKWRIPGPVSIAPNGYYVLFASGKTYEQNPGNYPYVDGDGALHTNFGLGAEGDYLALVKPDGMTIVYEYAPEYPEQRGFVSYGISSSGEVGYLVSPTPGSRVSDRWRGAANSAKYDGVVADTKFSRDRGFYYAEFSVEITCETPGATIRYTTDGSEPTLSHGSTASGPIPIRTTTCLRAAAFKTGWLGTNIDAQSYIFPADVVTQTQAAALAKGYPSSWEGYTADYEMDPDVYDHADYRDDMVDALLAIPTLSVSSDRDNLFGSSNGIYTHAKQKGLSWERHVSAEFFDVNGAKEWHANCGMRVQGGASRNATKAPKHSLSLRFRGGYGPGQLEYNLFGKPAADHQNSLQLRAMFNNSWIHWSGSQNPRGSLIRDQWARDSLLAMGRPDGGYGTYAHVYLNGIYWGVFNIHERPEASHYDAYFGGGDDQLDAVNSGSAVDGSSSSWNSLQSLVSNAVSGGITLAEYLQIQQKLDVVNLIDYMIINHYGANHDWDSHNWRAGGGGENDLPWRIFAWDTERILEGTGDNEMGTNNSGKPSRLFHNLRNSTEFKLLFADRLHKHFFNDGAMTPANTAARWMKRAAELDMAIICESARWGDYRRDVESYGRPSSNYALYTKNGHWLPEQSRLINGYFPGRSTTVFNRYKTSYGLYPSLAAPSFSPHGGWDLNGFPLTMTRPATVYYTTDGADPRLPGGAVNTAHAEVYSGGTISLTASTHVRARAKSGSTWSALNEAVFSVGPVLENLRITEIMYHPQNTGDPQDPNEEF
ncbi:MAG: chitobiase/beta-hexosaminidase C-terminal domain-containing protein, partial [Phycisphaerae bacterium]|nr:chitobiase/beta-hexosaminidase C-terminal domain-containing protein [Phycisphaerae bacterium]